MIDAERLAAVLSDARLAGLLSRRGPAWAFRPDGTLALANAGGLAAFGGADALGRGLPQGAPLRREFDRLLRDLSRGGESRLERLRLPGSPFTAVTAACRRLVASPLGEVVTIASLEEGGERAAPLADVARLIAALVQGPAVVLDGAGALLARSAAADMVRAATSLGDLVEDAPAALAEAAAGPATRLIAGGRLTLHAATLGSTTVVIGALNPADEPPPTAIEPPPEPVHQQPAEPELEPEPGPPEPESELDVAEPEPEPAAPPAAPALLESREAAMPAEPTVPPPSQPEPAASGRRLPLRFVWQTDAGGLVSQVSGELAEAVGARAAAVVGESLTGLAARLGFDPDGRITRALAKHDTWSGVNVVWPTDFGDLALIDLAGLPVFDRARAFQGYRGFGVCRAVQPAARREAPSAASAAPPPQADAPAPAKPEVPTAKVLPLRAPEARKPQLSAGERVAFQEIGRVLGAAPPANDAEPPPKAKAAAPDAPAEPPLAAPPVAEVPVPEVPISEAPVPEPPAPEPPAPEPPVSATPAPEVPVAPPRAIAAGEWAVLERLPLAILVYRGERILFANAALLDWTGWRDIADLEAAGGLAALFDVTDLTGAEADGKSLSIRGAGGAALPVEARLYSAPVEGEAAMVLALRRTDGGADARIAMVESALGTAEAAARELRAILDTATDGVVLTDRDGRILSVNGAAEALFGYNGSELAGRSFGILFAPESQRAAFDYLDGLLRGGVASVLNDGREVIGRVREGGLIPLFMTMGRITEDGVKFCAVLRDITQWKRAEEELVSARRAAERASSLKSDFLAKISHEIRTPLNAIIGFSEVMMEERFGPIGNPRYKDYLKDIHTSGTHVVSLVNDLLDLSKIEAGKLELEFVSVDLNDVLAQCMALMQPQANRERIIIRASLAPRLPPVVADVRSIRQIVLNLLSNSIRFTQPGGQVILSTALADGGEVVMRVRDTGVGMSEAEVAAALEPFRQIATAHRTRGDGTGLGLPLTKALVEANRASFAIRSGVNAGTMVEVTFPATRVLAE